MTNDREIARRVVAKFKVDPSRRQFIRKLQEEASKLGRDAFEAGKKRVPGQDKALMDFIFKRSEPLQEGESIPLMEAWTAAWVKASLAANPIR
jgi:hypothetical protein